MKRSIIQTVFLILSLGFASGSAWAQTSEFTYQGRITQGGNPINATRGIQFYLFDENGVQIPGAVLERSVTIVNGIFSATIDFGAAAFASGANRSLQIAVQTTADPEDGYTFLSPRQPISSAPYAIKSKSSDTAANAATATNAEQLGGVNASDYLTTTSAGSTFIKNGTTQQTGNFNISGNGSVAGRVGIGTASPVMPLDVRGSMVLDNGAIYTASSGGEQNRYVALVNSPTTQTASGLKAGGVLVSDDYFYANPAKNNLIVKGDVGIGTATPQSKLTVQTPNNNYGLLHTDGAITVGSFVGGASAPGGFYGTFSNHPLHFFTANNAQRMTITTGGNVGIGTTAASTRLAISGGPGWTSNGWAGSLSMGNASALGWEANASGQRFGIGQTNGGLYFFRTNSAFGNTSSPANYDMAITDTGNISQSRDKGGLVKAMVLVDPFLPASQYVVRCYNFLNDSSTAPCGIAVTRTGPGDYRLDMGFDTSDRFASATLARAFQTQYTISVNPTGASVFIYLCHSQDSGACNPRDERFFLIIY